MSYIYFTKSEKDLFNDNFLDSNRELAMSIYAFIKNTQNKITGYLNFSLDRAFKRYRNKFYTSLSNFKKIANKLVEIGLLTFIRKGKPKFYGTLIFNGKTREKIEKKDDALNQNESLKEELEKLRNENKALKEENSRLKEGLSKEEINKENYIIDEEDRVENIELRSCIEEHKNNEENKIIEYNKEPMEDNEVLKLAKAMMKGEGIRENSSVYLQVLKSLKKKLKKEKIHSQGADSYIAEVIKEKKIKKLSFSNELKRKLAENKYKPLKFHNYKGRNYSDKYWSDLEKGLLENSLYNIGMR